MIILYVQKWKLSLSEKSKSLIFRVIRNVTIDYEVCFGLIDVINRLMNRIFCEWMASLFLLIAFFS